MKNKTERSPALDLTMPDIKEKQTQTINGKAISKYTHIFILSTVICENCKNSIAPNQMAWTTNMPELEQLAEATHSQGVTAAKIICASPKLVIIFSNGLANSDMLKG